MLTLIPLKMSKPKTTGLFRPWNDLEINKASGIAIVDGALHNVSCSRQEDDEQVVSSTTSTTLTSIAETSDDCDGNFLNQETRTEASSSLIDYRRTRIKGSESLDDVATRITPILENEDVSASHVQGARSNSRVFQPQQPVDSMIPIRDSDEFDGPSDANSSSYLSTLKEFRPSEDFASIIGAYPMTIANLDVAGAWSSESRIPDVSRIHSYPGVQPGFQSGIYPGIFPLNLYNHSMEEAVQLVHRQDVVAKEMKKMRPKKHSCPHCSMAFSNGGQLTGHIRIHTGERPFKCDVESCGKRFTRNEELTRHKRIHTGVRPYSCVFCKKRFGRKDHLKKHMRTHEVSRCFAVSLACSKSHNGGWPWVNSTVTQLHPDYCPRKAYPNLSDHSKDSQSGLKVVFHGDGVTIIINISMKGDEELVILSEDRKN